MNSENRAIIFLLIATLSMLACYGCVIAIGFRIHPIVGLAVAAVGAAIIGVAAAKVAGDILK